VLDDLKYGERESPAIGVVRAGVPWEDGRLCAASPGKAYYLVICAPSATRTRDLLLRSSWMMPA
jgi:hypothetical protein